MGQQGHVLTRPCSLAALGSHAPASGLGVLRLVAALLLGISAGLACGSAGGRDGVGGQSGDEGRRLRPHGLGTGGVAAELPPRR
jgi:hypothetical protein